MTEHGHAGATRLIVGVLQHATDRRPGADQRKQAAGDDDAVEALGFTLTGEVERRRVIGANRIEDPAAIAEVDVLRARDHDVLQMDRRQVAPDDHETIRVGIGKRTQHDRVDDAEDGGGRADGERQRRHDGRREERVLSQPADRIPKIANDVADAEGHRSGRRRTRGSFAHIGAFSRLGGLVEVELRPRRAHGFLVRGARGAQLVVAVVEMLLHLLVHRASPVRHAPPV